MCHASHTHTHTHTYTQSDICSVLRVHMYLSRHVTRSLFKILKGSVVLWAPFTHMQTYKHSLTPAVPTGLPPLHLPHRRRFMVNLLLNRSGGKADIKQIHSLKHSESCGRPGTSARCCFPDRPDFTDLPDRKNWSKGAVKSTAPLLLWGYFVFVFHRLLVTCFFSVWTVFFLKDMNLEMRHVKHIPNS